MSCHTIFVLPSRVCTGSSAHRAFTPCSQVNRSIFLYGRANTKHGGGGRSVQVVRSVAGTSEREWGEFRLIEFEDATLKPAKPSDAQHIRNGTYHSHHVDLDGYVFSGYDGGGASGASAHGGHGGHGTGGSSEGMWLHEIYTFMVSPSPPGAPRPLAALFPATYYLRDHLAPERQQWVHGGGKPGRHSHEGAGSEDWAHVNSQNASWLKHQAKGGIFLSFSRDGMVWSRPRMLLESSLHGVRGDDHPAGWHLPAAHAEQTHPHHRASQIQLQLEHSVAVQIAGWEPDECRALAAAAAAAAKHGSALQLAYQCRYSIDNVSLTTPG